VVVGTYSSIYIASPALLYLNLRRTTFSEEDEEAEGAGAGAAP